MYHIPTCVGVFLFPLRILSNMTFCAWLWSFLLSLVPFAAKWLDGKSTVSSSVNEWGGAASLSPRDKHHFLCCCCWWGEGSAIRGYCDSQSSHQDHCWSYPRPHTHHWVTHSGRRRQIEGCLPRWERAIILQLWPDWAIINTFSFHRNSKNSCHVVFTITETAVYSWIHWFIWSVVPVWLGKGLFPLCVVNT